MKLPGPRYDVAIVGAGIAGSSLGFRLSRLGLRVLLVDRAVFPRPKLCGEGLMPEGVRLLQALFAEGKRCPPGGRPFSGLRIWSGPASPALDLDFNPGRLGRVIPRLELDLALLELAVSSGVDFLPAFNVRGIETDASRRWCSFHGGGRAAGKSESFSARLLVDAGGVNSRLHRLAGISVRRSHPRCAVQTTAGEFRDACPQIEIFCGPGGEAYVAALEEGARITFLLDPGSLRGHAGRQELRDHLFRSFPGLAARISGATEIRGSVRITRRLQRTAVPGLLLAGDAAGACDPINGQGMTIALRDGELIADLIRDRGLADLHRLAAEYPQARAAYFNPAYELAMSLRSVLGSPFLTRRLARRLRKRPEFARKVATLASEGASARNRIGILDRFCLLTGF